MRELVGAGTPREAADRASIAVFHICFGNEASVTILAAAAGGIAVIAAVIVVTPPR
jgi:hypothetical protein